MSTVVGIFTDNQQAGNAVADLKQKGYTESISLIAKDDHGKVTTEEVKATSADGVMAGATVGGLVGLFTGVISAVLPGAGLILAGPLALSWGVTGAALGALSGGLVGALVDLGFSENQARLYEEHILKGDVLIAAGGDEDKTDAMVDIFQTHGAIEIVQLPAS